jgi:tetratricopeptide (TPR) repeat protein
MTSNKRNTGTIWIVLAAIAIAFSGCQTMQKDILISSAGEEAYGGLAELEETIIALDGAGAGRDELARARQQVSMLQGSVADTVFEALLAAWSGRLFLMEGRNADAQREHRRSQSLSPNNLPAQILSIRLERNLSTRLSMIDRMLESESSSGELLAERGRLLFDLNRFAESVAAFDTAFVLLASKPYYEEAYRVFRDKAWELRDLQQSASSRIVEIAGQGEITWKDLVEITKNETDLLRFITAGRDWPAETIFAQLLERSFIPVTQNTRLAEWPLSKPSSAEIVQRSGAAWFLWHLYAENRANRGLLTRYSARFANTPNARSPVSDLDINSPFFDSVLGCVESEFMSLPDGRNFMPAERVRGSDFLAMLKKL